MLMTTFALAWRSRPGASLRPDSQCPQHPEQAGVQLPRTDRGVDSVDEPALNEVRPLTFDIFGTGRAAVERGGLVKAGFRRPAEATDTRAGGGKSVGKPAARNLAW